MNKPNKTPDFSSRAGTFMTIAAWLIFFIFLFSIFDYSISQRNNPNQNVVTLTEGYDKQVILQRNVYGHYVTNGSIDEQEVTFLLDTGATDIAIPENLADKIGLVREHAVMVKTANGNVKAYRTHLAKAAIGDIALYDLNATILTNMHGNEALLGMSFLKHFEITQKGKTLTIKQQH